MSLKLTEREQMILKASEAGKNAQQIADEMGLKISSVRTYLYAVRRKIKEAEPRTIVVKKSLKDKISDFATKIKEESRKEPELRRCRSFNEFKAMMDAISVKGHTLEERVLEFKSTYCKVCIYPSRCNECPTKVLMEKYLEI